LLRRDDKKIVVTPIIDARRQFGPSSIDVRLGTEFVVLETANLSHVNTLDDAERLRVGIERYSKKIHIDANKPFHLHPGEFALACTLEYVKLPDDIAGRIEGRSSWGRVGLLVHATAGFIDPGFAGTLTFELSNAGRVPITLKPGLRVGQICFMKMLSRSRIPYDLRTLSKYAGAMGVQVSRIYRDVEIGPPKPLKSKQ
jgi:dCTP deaminase